MTSNIFKEESAQSGGPQEKMSLNYSAVNHN